MRKGAPHPYVCGNERVPVDQHRRDRDHCRMAKSGKGLPPRHQPGDDHGDQGQHGHHVVAQLAPGKEPQGAQQHRKGNGLIPRHEP